MVLSSPQILSSLFLWLLLVGEVLFLRPFSSQLLLLLPAPGHWWPVSWPYSLAFSRMLHPWNQVICSLLSLISLMQQNISRSIHAVVWISSYSFLLLSSAPMYEYTAVYLFTSWGTLGLLPEFSHCEKSHYKHSHTIFFFFWCEHMSSFLLPRCGIAGLNDKCVFNFYKKLLNHFPSGCSILHSEKGLELRLHLYHLRSPQ